MIRYAFVVSYRDELPRWGGAPSALASCHDGVL